MIEPEVAFADLEQNMALIEAMFKYAVQGILEKCVKEIRFLETAHPGLIERLQNVVAKPFAKMRYAQALEHLKKAVASGHVFQNHDLEFGVDLATEHERYLCEHVINGPLFVTHYPKSLKAFYMTVDKDNQTVLACDLLLPGVGEIVGGSQREGDYGRLIQRCREMNIPAADIQWYADLRKYGYFKSAGFGLGLDRLLMYVTGVENIRDVIPFARTAGSVKF